MVHSICYFDHNYNAVFCCYTLDQFYGKFQNFNKNMHSFKYNLLEKIWCSNFGVTVYHFQPGPKTESHWECQTCMSDKFPFTLGENEVIVPNSSFSRKC